MQNDLWSQFFILNALNCQSISDEELRKFIAYQSRNLFQRMSLLNQFVLLEDFEKTQVKTPDPPSDATNKSVIRKQCIERYKAKKHNWAKKTQYSVRKIIADRRLRVNGQFLTVDEQSLILSMQKILGNNIVATKNHNIRIKGINKQKLTNKESILKYLRKLDPEHVVLRIASRKPIFKIF